jgi:lytic murein transglycosylase
LRRIVGVFVFFLMLGSGVAPSLAEDFAGFIAALKPEAERLGVSAATFDAATRDLTPDLTLPNLDLPGRRGPSNSGQSEFSSTPAQYLASKALTGLAAQGRQLASRHRASLAAIEDRYGVPGEIVLAIYGRESGYGRAKIPYDAVRVLATQAYAGRRKQDFRQEFLLALKMLQDGVPRAQLRSSWAGAVGLGQMLPSQYYKYGVDLDGDGRVNIWSSEPDVFASIANHLAGEGWTRGLGWAFEVAPPAGTLCSDADPGKAMPIAAWLTRGFTVLGPRAAGSADRAAPASLFMPAGPYGPAFLITRNYYALKAYNFSDLYVLFVGTLADRIGGGAGFVTAWRAKPQGSVATIAAIQRALADKGYYNDSIDGKAGMQTRLAIGRYQQRSGLPVDCWPAEGVLGELRAASR